MTNREPDVRGILEDLVTTVYFKEETMLEARTQLRTLLVGKLPKEKIYFKRDFNKLSRYNEAKLKEKYYNQALTEVKAMLEEVLGGGE